jgi:hypothetical protein
MKRPGPTADTLRGTFPGCEDAPLASALVRLLAQGKSVTEARLAAAAGRGEDDVAAQLTRWPNIERDAEGAVTGFSGLTLRATAHCFEVGGRRLSRIKRGPGVLLTVLPAVPAHWSACSPSC